MAQEAKWYVVHTYSGYEHAVADTVMKAAENRGMTDLIQEVNIPLETVTELEDGVQKTFERKVFPGYVLVKMVMTDESWHLVRNVRGCTGFVGSGNKAIPLSESGGQCPRMGNSRQAPTGTQRSASGCGEIPSRASLTHSHK